MKIFFYSSLLIFLLSACSANNYFYRPDRSSVHTPPDAISNYIQYGEKDSIHSFLYQHENPIASIFLLHGNGGNLNGWSELADLFHQSGYQVFIIDYPSFGNSSGKGTHEDVFLSIQKGVEYFSEIPSIKGTKKLIMGLSLGGNLAIKAGADNPNVFDAMLIEGAFDTNKHVRAAKFIKPLRFLPLVFVKNQFDGNELIAKWTHPLLIIHSKEDASCPYYMAESLYNNAIATTKKELWTIKGAHLTGISNNFELYMLKMKALINSIDD